MINYNKNKLINECLVKYYETFSITLDTADYVPASFNRRILRYIFKNLRKQFRLIDKEDRIFQKKLRKNGSDRADRDEDTPKIIEITPEGQRSEPCNVAGDQSPQPESEISEFEPADLDKLENLLDRS